MTRTLFMTGNELRHRYVASVLASCLDICGVVAESKVPLTSYLTGIADEGDEVVRRHFAGRTAAESRLLGESVSYPQNTELLGVEHGGSNTPEVLAWVTARQPEVIILFGTSIIRPPLLTHFEGRIVNLHLGLSPYYRGSGTNFWPLVDGLPECVGATIHLATLRIDGGDILAQVRPEQVDSADRAHELGTKTIIAGARKLCRIVPQHLVSGVRPVKQDHSIGKLCRRKDFSHEAVLAMNRNFDRGMMHAYVADKARRDARYSIID